jgi:hypothetical protein
MPEAVKPPSLLVRFVERRQVDSIDMKPSRRNKGVGFIN